MKDFFIKNKILIIILSAVILLTAIWTPVIVILTKSNIDNTVTSSAVSVNTDISSVESVASESESSEVSHINDESSDYEPYSSSVSSKVNSKKPQKNDLPELEGGAEVNESALANTYKLLTLQKKLTIGYFGGSITGGSSAKKVIRNGGVFSEDGSMMDSYVNRVSSWFKEKFPEAKIETVNSGVSDTHSQFGVYRLEDTLMNSKGHDMPDLVFIEFTTNDWIYGDHTKEVIKAEVESIIVNIRKINPYADIVIVATNVSSIENSEAKQAHKEVADYYGLPFIDVGSELQKNKTGRGYPAESAKNGTLYYTTDNLHPSAEGFKVYLKTITPVLSEHLDGLELKSNKLYSYRDNTPSQLSSDLITPNTVQADKFTLLDKATLKPYALTVSMYGTSVNKAKMVSIVDWCVSVEKDGSIKADFVGNSLGIFISMSDNNVEIEYSIDGGEWNTFAVNNSKLSHQKYAHLQAFSLKNGLSDGSHTVTIRNKCNKTVNIGGILAEK